MNLNQILINSIETIKKDKKKIKKISEEETNTKNKELINLEYQLNLYNKNRNKHKEDLPRINLTQLNSTNTTLEDIDNFLSESQKKNNKKTLTMSEKWTLIKNYLNDNNISEFKIYKKSFLDKTLKITYDKDGKIENLEL